MKTFGIEKELKLKEKIVEKNALLLKDMISLFQDSFSISEKKAILYLMITA